MFGGRIPMRWIVIVTIIWLAVFFLDEVTYYWWKDLNPGSSWSGFLVKEPPTGPTPTTNAGQTPNG